MPKGLPPASGQDVKPSGLSFYSSTVGPRDDKAEPTAGMIAIWAIRPGCKGMVPGELAGETRTTLEAELLALSWGPLSPEASSCLGALASSGHRNSLI